MRGIRNYSGLNKNALLDLLGVGTIWMSVSMSKMNQNSHTQQNEAKSYTTEWMNAVPLKKVTQPYDALVTAFKKTPIKKKSTVKVKSTTNWIMAPKVSKSMTMTQMTHELMSRGYPGSFSNKTKADLLLMLGEGSVWTPAPTTNY